MLSLAKLDWAAPLTCINCDGPWICDITTEGNDHQATAIAAYRILEGYDPPLADGEGTLPIEFMENAVAQMEAMRSPDLGGMSSS